MHLPISDGQTGGDNGGNGSDGAPHVAPPPDSTFDPPPGFVGSLSSRTWGVVGVPG